MRRGRAATAARLCAAVAASGDSDPRAGQTAFEIHVEAPVEVCRRRDPKGLYARAERGKVANVTGFDQAYEPPEDPALVVNTAEISAEEAADRIVATIARPG